MLTGDLGHTICGPWGCGPPLEALLACHLAWIVVLTPAAGWIFWSGYFSATTVVRIGQVLVGVGMAWLIGVLAYQVLVWLPQAGVWQRAYLPQRYGFVIATTVDFPMVQCLLIGGCVWAAGRRRLRTDPKADEPPLGEFA